MGVYPAAEKQRLPAYTILSDDAGVVPMYRALARRYVEDLYRRWGRPQEARRYAAANNHPPAVELANSPVAALLTAK